MSQWEKTLVPLDACHEILSSFAVGPDSRGYQRWRREDGFRWVDLEDVLTESKLVLAVDWREGLPEVMDTIVEQLKSLEIAASADVDDEGDRGFLEADGKRVSFEYSSADEHADFTSIIEQINKLIAGKARYRQFQSSIGSDGWKFGLLSEEEWNHLNKNVSDTVRLLFGSE